jgi:hypothetical protein
MFPLFTPKNLGIIDIANFLRAREPLLVLQSHLRAQQAKNLAAYEGLGSLGPGERIDGKKTEFGTRISGCIGNLYGDGRLPQK